MPGWQPIKRREFIRKLRALGFVGPYRGTRHDFLMLAQHRQTIPSNPEFSVPQLRFLLRQVQIILRRSIPPDEWQRL
jgi:hypothetical protein